MQNKRRLFNIRVDEVSLVDKAANTRKFLIMKRDGEGEEVAVEELKVVLKNIEKSLNDLADRIDGQDERLKSLEPSAEELKKAGAKFSKATLARLKTIHGTLGELLSGIDFGDEETDTKKSSDEISAAVLKGIQDGMTPEKEKKDDQTDIKKVLEDVVRTVLNETKDK